MKKVKCTISLLMVGVILALSGCMPTMQTVKRIPFPEEEYLALPKMGTGTATIRGQAFLKTRGGDVKYAAGNEIHLFPVTSYSDQWYRVMQEYPKKILEQKYDPRYSKYWTTMLGDGEGNFEFKNVPAGNYYLSTTILWEVPQRGGYLWPTGGTIGKKISVEEGQELGVIFTR